MSLPHLPAAAIAQIASTLTITDFVTGARTLWVPSRAQIRAWEAAERHQRVFVGKPRRAYISTAFDLDDVLQTVVADTAGHRIRTGVMLDVEAKVTERMWQMSDFLNQMGIDHRATDFHIELAHSGSQIVGLTAGGKRAAASTGFQRMRYSEFSYYTDPQAYIATSASVGIMGREVIETTVDISATNGKAARAMWLAAQPDAEGGNGYHPLFVEFEWLDAYKTNPNRITDEQWVMAQGEGFTDRSAAAYWLGELLPAKAAGNLVMLMHEYPQKPDHMFSAATGLWIKSKPKDGVVVPAVDRLRVPGFAGDEWTADIYIKPDAGHRYIVVADVAANKQRDKSTAMVVDMDSRQLCAEFSSNQIMGDDHARVIQYLWNHYTTHTRNPVADVLVDAAPILHTPRVAVEENGVGSVTTQPLQRLGVPHEAFTTDANTKHLGMLEAKRAIEGGMLRGSSSLDDECNECHVDEKTGRWKGAKDLLMTYGFAAIRISQSPATHTVREDKSAERRIFAERMIRQQQIRVRLGRG